MKTYRELLQELGGWDNELAQVPAGSVRKIIEELEATQRELAAVKQAFAEARLDALFIEEDFMDKLESRAREILAANA